MQNSNTPTTFGHEIMVQSNVPVSGYDFIVVPIIVYEDVLIGIYYCYDGTM